MSTVTSGTTTGTLAAERGALGTSSGLQLTKELDEKAQSLIRTNMLISLGVGFIPVPLLDLAVLAGQQLYMVRDLGHLYGQEFNEELVKKSVMCLIGGGLPTSTTIKLAASSLLRVVPLVGPGIALVTQPLLAGATTYAIGQLFNKHFSTGGTFLTFDPTRQRRRFQQLVQEGMRVSRAEVAPPPAPPAPVPQPAPTPVQAPVASLPTVTPPVPGATPATVAAPGTAAPTGTVMVFDGQNSLVSLPQPLPALPAGVTIEFWPRGADDLPWASSIFAAWRPDGTRILNIHLPWSDGQIYWDAGSEGTAFDRIQKAAEPGEYKGSWAHWAFVKDVARGEMAIYRGGVLWHRDTGRSRPITESAGANIGAYDGAYKWGGRLAEFRLWDRPRTEEEIRADVGRRLTGREPGLIGYWPLSQVDPDGTTPDLAGQRPGTVQGATTAPDDALAAALAPTPVPAPTVTAPATGAPGAGRAAVDLPSVQFLSGSFSTWRGQDAGWSLDQGVGEREFVKHVAFSKRFDAPPQVVVELNGLDVDQSKNTRVTVSARDVTPEGFDLVLGTWSDSIVYSLGANWLALESGRVALSAGSFSTWRGQDATWKLDQGIGEREHVKHVTFSKHFDTPPQVVVGSSFLDVDQSKNTRVEVSARDVTPEGFDLVLKTWSDSIVYSLGANWLALEPGRVAFSAGSFWTGRDEGAAWKLDQGMGEREYVKHVAFSKRFDTPPQVVVGSSFLDVDQSKNTRVEVSARDVTPEGFDLVLGTWSDSIVYSLGANWLALAPPRPTTA